MQLTPEEEEALASWVYEMAERNMGVPKIVILKKAKQIAEAKGNSFGTSEGEVMLIIMLVFQKTLTPILYMEREERMLGCLEGTGAGTTLQ
jgi:hypothetical protein